MNPLLEKYDELYGPKVEETAIPNPEYNEFPEGYLYSHVTSGRYIGEKTYDVTTEHNIEWNGKYWERKEFVNLLDDSQYGANSYTGLSSINTLTVATPSLSSYGSDVIDFNQPQSSLKIDGKDIKDIIKEEVEKQLKEQQQSHNKQTKAVIDLLEKIKKGTATVSSYQSNVSYDLGGSTTSYTVVINE